MAVARLLRDAGMEVIYLGRFNLPPAIVKAAAFGPTSSVEEIPGTISRLVRAP